MGNKYKRFSKVGRAREVRRCLRKRAYKTEAEAYQKGQEVYQCPYCHQWHRTGALTSLKRELEKKRQAKERKAKNGKN